MNSRLIAPLAVVSLLLAATLTADAAGRVRKAPRKTVLVELFTSQG